MVGKASKSISLACVLLCHSAYAEPSVGGGHFVVLSVLVLVMAGALAAVPSILQRKFGWTMTRKVFWIATVVPPLAFFGFVGPVIVVLGSILLLGRTM